MALGEFFQEVPNRHADAELAFRKATEVRSTDSRAWVALGEFLQEIPERQAEAEAAFLRATETGPTNSQAWVALGESLQKIQERKTEAETAFRRALELDGNNLRAILGLVTILLTESNRRDEAVTLATEISDNCRTDALVLDGLAWAFYCAHPRTDLCQAVTWAEEAVKLMPAMWFCQHTYACILCALDRGQEALSPAKVFFGDAQSVSETVDIAIELGVELAVAGVARQTVDLLRESPSVQYLEPLVVGLELFLGEDVKAPEEILEVGKDVAKRIAERSKPQGG